MDWLFSSDAGRRQVADSAGFERLVIVTLHRGHTYQGGVGGVKEEVGGRVVELVQAGVPPGKQVMAVLQSLVKTVREVVVFV